MTGIEELLEKEIEVVVNRSVAAKLAKIDAFKPWLAIDAVKELVGFKDSQWIINHFCISKDGMPKEAFEMGLVKKKSGRWIFKNPEFKKYLHDVWFDMEEE